MSAEATGDARGSLAAVVASWWTTDGVELDPSAISRASPRNLGPLFFLSGPQCSRLPLN